MSKPSAVKWMVRAMLALAVAVSLTSPATACHPPRLEPPNIKILWDDRPAIEPGEVAVKVRFLRKETIRLRRDPSAEYITSLCGVPQPPPPDEVKIKVSVYQVIRPPIGIYRSSKVTIIGEGYERPFTEGWMVGRPGRINPATWGLPLEGTPLPEPMTIAWRLPPCPQYHYCPAFNHSGVKFDE
jgi:hypothetical protein